MRRAGTAGTDTERNDTVSAPIPTNLRIVVVGANGRSNAPSFRWGAPGLPNVTDYDVAILDLRSLQDVPDLRVAKIQAFQKLLGRLLDSGGQVIAIANSPNQNVSYIRDDNRRVEMSRSFVLPMNLTVATESGTTVVKKSAKFERYLSHLKRWHFHFVIGSKNGRDLDGTLEPYLVNREGMILAGERRWENGARFVLLPDCGFDDPQLAVDLVFEELVGPVGSTPPPSWSADVAIPGMDALDSGVRELKSQIDTLHSQARTLEVQRAELEAYRRLVYCDGAELEDIVAKSFTLLGGQIAPAKYGTEEFILIHNGLEHLMEVKGINGTAALKHVRQLLDNLMVAEDATGRAPHGILVANTWRTRPLRERDGGGIVHFPPNVIERAVANGMALLTGHSLLKAVCRKLRTVDSRDVLDQIASGVGIVDIT